MKNQPFIEACRNFRFRNTPETLRYFYHPDHIGSTSWVTDSAKNGIQYCEYLPFGEPFIDQRSTTWNSRYTFSGKERDGETGYSYFGARYYNSDISIWLSVDPMADKYPNLTPYAYCANNPIVLVDPDGRSYDGYEDGIGNYFWFDYHSEESFIDENNTTWTRVTSDKDKWEQAITIHDAVVIGLVQLGHNETDVKKDVRLYSENSPLFTKEAQLNNPDKYTSDWESKVNSETGKKDAFQSKQISNTGYALKYYPTKGGVKNANAIGLIKSAWSSHLIEAGIEFIERKIYGQNAVNDPLYDMHYNNAKDFIYNINNYKVGTEITIPIYYQRGHK